MGKLKKMRTFLGRIWGKAFSQALNGTY